MFAIPVSKLAPVRKPGFPGLALTTLSQLPAENAPPSDSSNVSPKRPLSKSKPPRMTSARAGDARAKSATAAITHRPAVFRKEHLQFYESVEMKMQSPCRERGAALRLADKELTTHALSVGNRSEWTVQPESGCIGT